MQDGLATKRTQAPMSMYNLNLLADDDIPEDREEREDGGEGAGAVDDEKGHVVDFEAIGDVAHAGAAVVGVCDYYDFVAEVD